MLQCFTIGLAVLAAMLPTSGMPSMFGQNQSPAPPDATAEAVLVIREFKAGIAGVCTARPNVQLSVGRDVSFPGEQVLVVDYPAQTDDPAGRDVQCAAESRDWTVGRAIAFQIKPVHALRLSLSFRDRNRVAYTSWTELKGGVWQVVQIPFLDLRPNPYFQPPDARTGTPLDVSAVEGIGFAPQDRTSGRLLIRSFVVTK